MTSTKSAVRCYLAPDWGMALRISSLLETEFDDREVIGGWFSMTGRCHGTVFAIDSGRFPESWSGRLLRLQEQPWIEGFSGKLELETNPEWIDAVDDAIRRHKERP